MKNWMYACVITFISGSLLACGNNTNRQDAPDDSVEQVERLNDSIAATRGDDTDFAVKAADAGLAEVQLGELALQKASAQSVKDFARKMIDDHKKANDELKAIADRKGITLPPAPGKDHVDHLQKMQDKSGAEFDRDYISMMVDDHAKVVDLFEKAANDAEDTDLKSFAAKTLPVLKQHHEEAKRIKDQLK